MSHDHDVQKAVLAALLRTAKAMLVGQPLGHSLSATELVDLAYVAIQKSHTDVTRDDFRRLANAAMRCLIKDRAQARRRRRKRETEFAVARGSDAGADERPDVRLLQEELYMNFEQWLDALEALNEAMAQAVAVFRARFSDQVRWHLVGGQAELIPGEPLTVEQAATALGMTRATAYRRWDLFLDELQQHEHLGALYNRLYGEDDE